MKHLKKHPPPKKSKINENTSGKLEVGGGEAVDNESRSDTPTTKEIKKIETIIEPLNEKIKRIIKFLSRNSEHTHLNDIRGDYKTIIKKTLKEKIGITNVPDNLSIKSIINTLGDLLNELEKEKQGGK